MSCKWEAKPSIASALRLCNDRCRQSNNATQLSDALRDLSTSVLSSIRAQHDVRDSVDELLYNCTGMSTIAAYLEYREGRVSSPPVATIDAVDLVRRTVEDVHAHGVEKFGAVAPLVVQSTSSSLELLCLPSHMRWVFAELLKNSIAAHDTRYTAAAVDDTAPIVVRCSGESNAVRISVSDAGGGIVSHTGTRNVFPWIPVTSLPTAPDSSGGADWRYSRQFGAAFSGLGVGLPRSRLLCIFGGGGLSLTSHPGHGTVAEMHFSRDGNNTSDVWLPEFANR